MDHCWTATSPTFRLPDWYDGRDSTPVRTPIGDEGAWATRGPTRYPISTDPLIAASCRAIRVRAWHAQRQMRFSLYGTDAFDGTVEQTRAVKECHLSRCDCSMVRCEAATARIEAIHHDLIFRVLSVNLLQLGSISRANENFR